MHFHSPALLLLLLIVAAALVWRLRRRPAATRFSSTAGLGAMGGSWRVKLAPLPTALRALALALVVIALARPQLGVDLRRQSTRGIAIEMVVDRSSSMGAEMRFAGRSMTRLEAVKEVFEAFVSGGRGLPGRPDDLVGMIAFARYADTACPLTLSHETLVDLLRTVSLAGDRSEDGTAIGDALALAAARLEQAEKTLARQTGAPPYDIRSKIIILLTDGENNAGRRGIAEAARLAAEWGVKVYAISVGEDRRVQTPFGTVTLPKRPGVDDAELRRLAETTGGLYRQAGDAAGLVEVYREIDALETSAIEAPRSYDYREMFMPFAAAALCLLGLETLLRSTLLRVTA